MHLLVILVLACLAQAATGLRGNVVVSATYPNVPVFEEALDDRALIATFTVSFGEPIFFSPPSGEIGCQPAPSTCSDPVFAPCCLDCSLPEEERAPMDCYCPYDVNATCVDSSRVVYGITDANGHLKYQANVLPGAYCQDYAVSVLAATGTFAGIGTGYA